jgi:D-inositol-3-phosphate glycosyltransferase
MARRIALLSMHTSPLAALGGKETGGMNVYVRELARKLGERGWQVDIYTRLRDPGAPVIYDEPGPACRTIHIPAGPLGAIDRRTLFQYLPEFVQGILNFSADEGLEYDLIHSHYWLSGWAARELKKVWDLPIVHMFHTLGRMKDSVAKSAKEREATNRGMVEQEIMQFADRIVAATPLDRQQMLDYYDVDEGKIVVVPCGVNLERFHPIPRETAREKLGLANGRRLILFVGRMDPVKGLDVLLEAMCELSRRLERFRAKNLSLAIIGGDKENQLEALMDDAKCLQNIVRDFQLDDLIMFIGSLSQETLPYYYSASEVCVMPSLYESFGMVALEAMACGTPVIASRVGGLTYTIRDAETGFLVPEKDPKALAEKLELLLTDECLRRRLGHRATQVVREYSWDVVTEAIEDVYAELGIPVISSAS